MKPWKRARSTPPPGEPLSPPGLVWLLVTLTLAVLLHAGQVPIWLVLGFLALAGWRAAIVWYSWSLPAPALRLLLALLAAGAVLAHYKTLLGRDAGVALLAAMAACKLLETRDLRDGVVLVFLGYLLVMGKLLYSQDIPVVAGLLGVVLLLLTAQMMLHRQHAGLSGLAPLRLAGRMMLLALPVMVWIVRQGSEGDIQLPSLLLLALMAWSIAIMAHILRHALDVPIWVGTLGALGYTFLSWTLTGWVGG